MVVVLCLSRGTKHTEMGVSEKTGYLILGGPYKKDPTIWGTVLGSRYFRKAPYGILMYCDLPSQLHQPEQLGAPPGKYWAKYRSKMPVLSCVSQ